jgi:hypothetical protein
VAQNEARVDDRFAPAYAFAFAQCAGGHAGNPVNTAAVRFQSWSHVAIPSQTFRTAFFPDPRSSVAPGLRGRSVPNLSPHDRLSPNRSQRSGAGGSAASLRAPFYGNRGLDPSVDSD